MPLNPRVSGSVPLSILYTVMLRFMAFTRLLGPGVCIVKRHWRRINLHEGLMRFGLKIMTFFVFAVPLFVHAEDVSPSWKDSGLIGDYSGTDFLCSQGATPRLEYCETRTSLQQFWNVETVAIAVCWTDRRTGECGRTSAWCRYFKDVIIGEGPQRHIDMNGGAPGIVYYCK